MLSDILEFMIMCNICIDCGNKEYLQPVIDGYMCHICAHEQDSDLFTPMEPFIHDEWAPFNPTNLLGDGYDNNYHSYINIMEINMSNVQYGKLAAQYGYGNNKLQVCESNAGFYIGTHNIHVGPISRESNEYYYTKKDAENALANGTWTQMRYDY